MVIQTWYDFSSLTSFSTLPAEIGFFVDALLGWMGGNGQSLVAGCQQRGEPLLQPTPPLLQQYRDPPRSHTGVKTRAWSQGEEGNTHTHDCVHVLCIRLLRTYYTHALHKWEIQGWGKSLGRAQGGDRNFFLKRESLSTQMFV